MYFYKGGKNVFKGSEYTLHNLFSWLKKNIFIRCRIQSLTFIRFLKIQSIFYKHRDENISTS